MFKRSGRIVKTSSSLQTQHGSIDFLLTRSKRRTMTIRIDEKAQIKISVPFLLQEKYIHDFIHEKAQWITQKVRELKHNQDLLIQKAFDQDHEYLFLGKKYKINITLHDRQQTKVEFNGTGWAIGVSSDLSNEKKHQYIREGLIKWYRNQAEEFLAGRLFHWARVMQVTPKKVSVRAQKRIWGSCHPRAAAIHLNWQIIMAPVEVIDYVLVHELCHLTVANHSKRFWQKVAKVLPDYKERKIWFKKHALDMVLPQ